MIIALLLFYILRVLRFDNMKLTFPDFLMKFCYRNPMWNKMYLNFGFFAATTSP